MSKTGKFSLQPPSFAGYRLINGSRKICYTSCPLSQELRRKKRLTTVGTHVFYMKAGSSFLEHGLPVQHPKREPRPFENPHYSPPNPEAKAGLTGKPDFARRMKRRNSKEARDTLLFLSTWPAAGGYSASRQKRRRARQSQQRLERSLGLEGRRLVHAAEELTEQSTARTGWGDGKERERFTPALHH